MGSISVERLEVGRFVEGLDPLKAHGPYGILHTISTAAVCRDPRQAAGDAVQELGRRV